jgi:hypothetical protein
MLNVNTNVILVIIRATGTISKPFGKYPRNLPEKDAIEELQKTVALGTSHVLGKVLM